MAQCMALAQMDGQQVAVAVDVAPCTSLVMLTPVEYSTMAENPFRLSIEDGVLISGAVGTVWAFAWAVRAVRSVLSDRDSSD